ncbi:formimidoylglutamate deiminase [Croceicoccus sp. Ery15]|uniref:formimidoylglutamate deiminase n=1 Tax=Croceicoccus sp. Ery15 TaxID=1703338 RepID=UPI001E48A17A|nr:formimidoylglutamate deiminase [Croceicoccus sp. Ery15]
MSQHSTLHFQSALLHDGWHSNVTISITDGAISAIENGSPPPDGAERHAIALPGMPNLHSHAFQRAMAGMAETRGPDGDNFWSWRDSMYRLASSIGPEQLRVIAAMAQMEMLESGFTRVGEFHYLHHAASGHEYSDIAEMSKAILSASEQTGIGITHLPVFYAHSGFGGQPAKEGQRRFICDLERFDRLLDACKVAAKGLPDAIVGIAPHSLRAVTPDELASLQELAADAPVHIHIAEQLREVEDCRSALGTTPVRWLLDNAELSARWCLIHATHVTDDEVTGIARTGASVGLCPITEANLGDGIFPAREFIEAGGEFGIGSDSNVRIDMSEELRLLEYGQRLSRQSRNIMASSDIRSTGRSLYQSAIKGGSMALGIVAALRVGASADIVSVNMNAVHRSVVSDDAVLDQLIFAAGSDAIDRVWRHGRCVVREGRHVARDRIEGDYRKVLTELMA